MYSRLFIHQTNSVFSTTRLKLVVIAGMCVIFLTACAAEAQSSQFATPTLTSEQALGREVYELHCKNCHSTIPDSIVVGPSLAGIAERASHRIEGMDGRDYLEMSISQPGEYLVEGYPDLMPATLAETLSEKEVEAVLNYIMTLED